MHAPAWANADKTRLGGISQRSASSDLFSLLYYLIVRLQSRSRSSPSFPLQYFRSIFRVCTNTNTLHDHPLPHHCSSYLSIQSLAVALCVTVTNVFRAGVLRPYKQKRTLIQLTAVPHLFCGIWETSHSLPVGMAEHTAVC